MARSWHYPRWRRVLMQVTLWVIFGGTVAMAAWVVHDRRPGVARRDWGPTIAAGDVRIRLPAGWDAAPGNSADVLLLATEHADVTPDSGDDGPGGRSLIVQQFNATPNQTAAQFLTTGGPLKNAMIVDGPGERPPTDDEIPSKPVLVGGIPGVMLETIRAESFSTGQPVMRVHEWIACAIVPGSGRAIVVRLQRVDGDVPGPGDETDDALLARVAGAMQIRNTGAANR